MTSTCQKLLKQGVRGHWHRHVTCHIDASSDATLAFKVLRTLIRTACSDITSEPRKDTRSISVQARRCLNTSMPTGVRSNATIHAVGAWHSILIKLINYTMPTWTCCKTVQFLKFLNFKKHAHTREKIARRSAIFRRPCRTWRRRCCGCFSPSRGPPCVPARMAGTHGPTSWLSLSQCILRFPPDTLGCAMRPKSGFPAQGDSLSPCYGQVGEKCLPHQTPIYASSFESRALRWQVFRTFRLYI